MLEQLKAFFADSTYPVILYDAQFSPRWQNQYARDAFVSYEQTKHGVLGVLDLALVRRRLKTSGCVHFSLAAFSAAGDGVTFLRRGDYIAALFCSGMQYSPKQRAFEMDGVTGLSEAVRSSVSEVSLAAAAIENLFDSDDPQVEALFCGIRKSNYRMLRSVRNATLLSRFYSGSLELAPVSCDVGATVAALCRSAADVQATGIPVRAALPQTPVETMLDVELFTRALLNVLLNSLTYTRDGNEIEVGVSETDAFVTVTVRDRGAGIKKENLSGVCDAFFSVEPADDGGVRPGLGLGLTVASLFCDVHGGSLIISSEFGEGTKVLMSFKKTACAGDRFETKVSRLVTDRFSPLYVELGALL